MPVTLQFDSGITTLQIATGPRRVTECNQVMS